MQLSIVLCLLFGILIGAGILSSKNVTITLFLIQVIFTILLATFGILDWIPQKDPTNGLYYGTSILFVLEILVTSLIFALVIRHALLNTILNQSKNAKFFEITLKSIKSGVILTDIEKKVLLINQFAEKMIGTTHEYTKGEYLTTFFHLQEGEKKNLFVDPFNPHFLSSKKHFRTNTAKLIGTKGDLVDIEFDVTPIRGEKKDIIGYIIIFRDITEREKSEELRRKFSQELELQVKIKTKELNDLLEEQKQYQEEILKSSTFKSEFMASMSHELRTPLNSIIGFSDVLLEKYYGDLNEKQYKFVGNVRSSADHLLDLINEILDISKIEAGKMELELENVNLLEVVNLIQTTLKPLFLEKKVEFVVGEISKEKIIKVDRKRFMEILYNLLSNALKYTKEGRVKLDILENEDYWVFNITDTGIGIANEDFDIIFKEFKRVNSKYNNSIPGTGLGLPLTKRLVELHGGNISFTSEIGEGSIFSFSLPRN
jgi:PAS domain S-box-containing protein